MIILSSLLFLSCEFITEQKHIKLSDRIVGEYLEEVKNKYDLHCVANGGGFLDKVNEIVIYFSATGPKTEVELREILVMITEDLLERYNRDEKIRPYLKNYPFTSANLSMGVTLKDNQQKSITNLGDSIDLLWGVFQNNGNISFVIENEDKPYLQEVHQETYEEALEIVKNQKPDLI